MNHIFPKPMQPHFCASLSSCGVAVCLFFAQVSCATAQDSADLQQQLEQLQFQLIQVQRESQIKLEALQRQTDAQLRLLQEQIAMIQSETVHSAASSSASQTLLARSPPPTEVATAPQTIASPSVLDRLHLAGDFRLRYETNSSNGPEDSWDRWVLRGRLAAHYELSDKLKVGARVVTGDPDNPRTTDVTLSDFASDLDISLDQAYVAYHIPNLLLTGGKFVKPFSSTELVWDGDVNPQGVGGYFDFLQRDSWSMRVSGLYFAINETTVAQSSDMLGGQLSLNVNPDSDWGASLYLAYFDYDMGLLRPLVPGGARGNTVTADRTRYVSDFNLLDTSGTISYTGLGDRWKLWLIANSVKNLGAEIPEDSGFGVDLFAGSLSHKGRWLLRYGYAQAGIDAVLGLYSHDNIIYPTNYRMHTISADYALGDHAFIGFTNYIYKLLDPDPLSLYDNDWASRTRLNLYFTF